MRRTAIKLTFIANQFTFVEVKPFKDEPFLVEPKV